MVASVDSRQPHAPRYGVPEYLEMIRASMCGVRTEKRSSTSHLPSPVASFRGLKRLQPPSTRQPIQPSPYQKAFYAPKSTFWNNNGQEDVKRSPRNLTPAGVPSSSTGQAKQASCL